MAPTILGLGGSLARVSRSRAALQRALEGAAATGAQTTLLDLRELDLPLYNPDDDEPGTAASELIESCYQADGLIWSSPLYQGTISGALKNALDWLHLLGPRDPPYLHDKVIGLIRRRRRNARATGDQHDGVRCPRTPRLGGALRRARCFSGPRVRTVRANQRRGGRGSARNPRRRSRPGRRAVCHGQLHSPRKRVRPSGRKGRGCDVSLFGVRRHAAPAELPVEGRLPGFDGAAGWLNSEPLTAEGLRGKVVLVDFWTYTCINWLRTLGYVRAWAEKYAAHGLVVVGVHTPEFPFERDVDDVRAATREMRVEYPIALDPDYAVWRAFANHYWPAVYVADAEGRIRHHQFGEGMYDECERVVQWLLGIEDGLVSPVLEGFEVQADWASLESPETYLGSEQGRSSDEEPDRLRLNHWTVSGDWTIGRRAAVLNEAGGRLAFRFHARDVNLVMGPHARGQSVPFQVLVDGEPPGDAHGLDVDDQGRGTLAQQRLYQLIREPGSISDRTFEIAFEGSGAEAYCFTFG